MPLTVKCAGIITYRSPAFIICGNIRREHGIEFFFTAVYTACERLEFAVS